MKKTNTAGKSFSDSQPASSNTYTDNTNAPYCKGRSSESKEVHHVTFAEQYNKYVNSDSGIVLSPDEIDVSCDVIDNSELNSDVCYSYLNEDGPVSGVSYSALTLGKPGPPIIKLHKSYSIESQDNPFLVDGELSRKADYILSHSTISRKRIRIADPDTAPVATTSAATVEIFDDSSNVPPLESVPVPTSNTEYVPTELPDELVPLNRDLVESCRYSPENDGALSRTNGAETSTTRPLLKDEYSGSAEHRSNGNGKHSSSNGSGSGSAPKKKTCCALQ